MKLWTRFKTLSRARQMGLFVLAFHLFFLSCLFIDHALGKKKTQRKIAIRTTLLKPRSFNAAPQTAKPPAQPNQITKKTPPTATQKQTRGTSPPRKENNVKRDRANEAKRSKQIQTKSSSQPSQMAEEKRALLEELAQNLSLLDASTAPPVARSSLSLPSNLTKHVVIEEEASLNASYTEALSAHLQESLNLPEFGEVKAKLTLDACGKLIRLEILESKSRKNSEFLKNRLPDLLYPCFNDFGILENENNFTITFTNA